MDQEKDMYEVSVCQCGEWDWQSSISYFFNTIEEVINFMKISVDNDLIVQIVKNPDRRALR